MKFGEKLGKEKGITSYDNGYFGSASPTIKLVYEYYVNRLMKDLKEQGEKRHGIKFIMWQEVMNNDLKVWISLLLQYGDKGSKALALKKLKKF